MYLRIRHSLARRRLRSHHLKPGRQRLRLRKIRRSQLRVRIISTRRSRPKVKITEVQPVQPRGITTIIKKPPCPRAHRLRHNPPSKRMATTTHLPRPNPPALAIQPQHPVATTIEVSVDRFFRSPTETGLNFGGNALVTLCINAALPGDALAREHFKSRGEHRGGEYKSPQGHGKGIQRGNMKGQTGAYTPVDDICPQR
jgi:hypothetical protein